MTPSIAPSLDDLRLDLERAELQIVCDDMIDNDQRRQIELERSRKRVADLKAQIARIDEAF